MKRDAMKLAVLAFAVAALTAAVHWRCVDNRVTYLDDVAYLQEAASHKTLSWETARWAFTTTRVGLQQASEWRWRRRWAS